jgi:hypothetical protein
MTRFGVQSAFGWYDPMYTIGDNEHWPKDNVTMSLHHCVRTEMKEEANATLGNDLVVRI